MKTLFTITFIIGLIITSHAQNSFVIALQPSMLLDRVAYAPYGNNTNHLLIESKPSTSFVFQLAYQRTFKNNVFFNVGGRILLLRSKVDYNIERSGFNDISEIYYDETSGYASYEYFQGVGFVAQIGYNLKLSQRSYLSILAGIHLDLPIVPVITNGHSFYTGNGGSQTVYEEDLTDGFKSSYFGYDGVVLYNFKVNEGLTFFAGLSVSIDPDQTITGTYYSYPSLPTAANAGAFSLTKNFASFTLGANLPIKKKK